MAPTDFLHSLRNALDHSNCAKRSDTRSQQTFTLSRPHPVTFDFSRGDSRSLEVTIPAHSEWTPVRTFHLDAAHCIALDTLCGWSWVSFASIERGSGSTRTDSGFHIAQTPRQYLWWGNHDKETAQSARITADAQLYRTLCSVVQDAGIYFSLCTTPLWIRLLYAVLGGSARAREWLVDWALFVQLRVVFYKNDCWTHQGMVRIDRFYWVVPEWVWKFQGWSAVILSQTTLFLLYWLGRLVLGMKESYEEYNVVYDCVTDEATPSGIDKT